MDFPSVAKLSYYRSEPFPHNERQQTGPMQNNAGQQALGTLPGHARADAKEKGGGESQTNT